MPATPVKIGPFAGGLNTYSEPTAVGDTEVVDIRNLEVDMDGSLYSRSPITLVDTPASVPGSGSIKPLLWFVNTNGDRYLVVALSSGSTYVRNEETDVWTLVTNTFAATCAVQYDDKVWLISSDSANNGGSWAPGGGFTAESGIPEGTSAVVYKERLFVGGDPAKPNRVRFSDAADFTTFDTGVNFFDVRVGDGQSIIKLHAFNDAIVIFKTDSTYTFSYDSNPGRGNVRLLNGAVGINNRNCMIEYENSLYVNYEDKLYQLSNWNFNLANLKVPFEYKNLYPTYTSEPSLSIMADRLVCHFYDNIYVFGLRTGTWTKWHVAEARLFNFFLQVPKDDPSEADRYYAGCRATTALASNRTLFEWQPEHNGVRSEDMDVYVTTKTYDFNVPYTFKRLFHWGVDLLSQNDLTYTVSPSVYSPAISHDELSAYTHDQITGSHLRPLSMSFDVSGTQEISNVSGARSYIKLLKSMRFRQITFTVGGSTDGTTVTGPIRIYSIIAFVDNKQLVSKTLS